MVRVGSIVIRVEDIGPQTRFWSAALDYVVREPASTDFVVLYVVAVHPLRRSP